VPHLIYVSKTCFLGLVHNCILFIVLDTRVHEREPQKKMYSFPQPTSNSLCALVKTHLTRKKYVCDVRLFEKKKMLLKVGCWGFR